MADYGISLQIDPAVMRSVARTIDAQRSIIESNFNAIFQEAFRLKNNWEGNSADAYHPVMEKLTSMQNEQSSAVSIVNALKEYVLDLSNIALGFDSADRQNKTLGDALPDDIFGV